MDILRLWIYGNSDILRINNLYMGIFCGYILGKICIDN